MVFNYLTETSKINVKVEQNSNNIIDLELDSCNGSVTAKPNEIKIFKCFITAQNVGTLELRARAETQSKGSYLKTDGEVQTLIVKYEGVIMNQIREVYLDFTNEEISDNSLKEILNIDMPKNVIEGSKKVYAMANSDPINNNWRDSLKNLINITVNFEFPALTTTCNLRMPALIQQIYQLNYLKIIDKSEKSAIDGYISNIENGLSTKCAQVPDDGSIISWTYADNNPTAANQAKSSTWMTAFLLKSVHYLRNNVDVSKSLIYYTTAWLKRQQVINGEFLETDPNFMVRPNVGHNGLYLTSFVYIALESDIKYIDPNRKAVSYISDLYPAITETYDLVIACYVFHLSKHENRDHCFDQIMKKSVIENGMRYWLGIDGNPDIETTSYGLLILVNRKVYTIAFNTFKYLKSIQKPNGTFEDSIQTSIALESMSALIKSLNNYDHKLKLINIQINDGINDHKMEVKPENEITQILELSADSKQIDLSANGYGSAVIQIVSQYNILGPIGNAFNTTFLNDNPNGTYVNLTVCTRYTWNDFQAYLS
jgi:hypothetical protein